MTLVSSRIASFLKEHGWILNLIFIALAGYFVAGAANAVVARSIRVLPSIDGSEIGKSRKQPENTSRNQLAQGLSAIADRNLMGAKREIMQPAVAAEQSDPTLVSGRNFKESDLKPCTLAAMVRATLVAEQAPEWSIAVLFDNASRESQVYSINEGSNKIQEDAALVDIRTGGVVVRRRDHFELCPCEGETPAGTSTGAVVATPPPTSTPSEGVAGAGVTKVSDTQYTVERTEVDTALSNLSEVATQARIVPSFKNGKPNGFKLFSIKPGSIYDKIGLKNGDVVQKINGYEMNSPDKALELYQKLKDAGSVAIELQRRGQTMNMNYTIR